MRPPQARDPRTELLSTHSGWPTVAGVIACIAGAYNVLSGIAAIRKDDAIQQAGKVLFEIDVSKWGWFWLGIGAVQIVAAILIFKRHPVAVPLAVGIAAASAIFTVFAIFTYPLWTVVVALLDICIIFSLVLHEDEFRR